MVLVPPDTHVAADVGAGDVRLAKLVGMGLGVNPRSPFDPLAARS